SRPASVARGHCSVTEEKVKRRLVSVQFLCKCLTPIPVGSTIFVQIADTVIGLHDTPHKRSVIHSCGVFHNYLTSRDLRKIIRRGAMCQAFRGYPGIDRVITWFIMTRSRTFVGAPTTGRTHQTFAGFAAPITTAARKSGLSAAALR